MAIPLPPPPSETVCVSARPIGAPIAAVNAAGADPKLAAVRRALRDEQPLPPVDPASLVRYVAPAPTRQKIEVRAAAAVDPADPTRGWLTVEAVTPLGRSSAPLHLTILLDASDSMYSVPFTTLPPLLDEGPGDAYRNVARIDIARAALLELTERLPSRADVALVVFDRDKAESLLPRPAPASAAEDIRFALFRASQEFARKGARTPLEAVYSVASASYDPCGDNRILLVTDDNDQMAQDREAVEKTVRQWADRGLELWTLSVGQLGTPTPEVEALTRSGRGVLLYADTVAEAVEPLSAALRATGVAVREPKIGLALAPGVEARPLTGAGGAWTLPQTLDAGWRKVELYELTFPEGTTAAGAVHLAASSPVPGEWTVNVDVPIELRPLAEADRTIRDRWFAWSVGRALAGKRGWDGVRALGRAIVREDGPARELQAWAERGG